MYFETENVIEVQTITKRAKRNYFLKKCKNCIVRNSQGRSKGFSFGGGGCKAFLPDFQNLYLNFLKRTGQEYSNFLI